jgi:hypothetical protein
MIEIKESIMNFLNRYTYPKGKNNGLKTFIIKKTEECFAIWSEKKSFDNYLEAFRKRRKDIYSGWTFMLKFPTSICFDSLKNKFALSRNFVKQDFYPLNIVNETGILGMTKDKSGNPK